MILKKEQILKIATILPYKENYSKEKASAASLWVSEFFKASRFKNENIVFGNTKSKNYLTKNYKNIKLLSLDTKFKSSTNEYVSKIDKMFEVKEADILKV